jgi:hypothetical protein
MRDVAKFVFDEWDQLVQATSLAGSGPAKKLGNG